MSRGSSVRGQSSCKGSGSKHSGSTEEELAVVKERTAEQFERDLNSLGYELIDQQQYQDFSVYDSKPTVRTVCSPLDSETQWNCNKHSLIDRDEPPIEVMNLLKFYNKRSFQQEIDADLELSFDKSEDLVDDFDSKDFEERYVHNSQSLSEIEDKQLKDAAKEVVVNRILKVDHQK